MNRLLQLSSVGQSPWLDDLHRTLIRGGDLERLIREDGLKGMTSNPAIFAKAIGGSDAYADALRDLASRRELDVTRIYEALAIEDIRDAADLFRPVFDETEGRDGFVSLEVSPDLAKDAERTSDDAARLWQAVGRKNLMIKIPATPAGITAIRRSIASGINVNVTLLFSLDSYEAVVGAYVAGLEDLIAAGGDPRTVASVASFFLSRIDTAVEARLGGAKADYDPELVASVTDRVAIASAKLAYAKYKALFSGPRWGSLSAKGAKPQRLLWASTSVKKPGLPETYYADALVGPETVDTMPPATMRAFRDQGTVDARALESDVEGAHRTLQALETLGVSLASITDELLVQGVAKFSEAFTQLLDGIAKRRVEVTR